LQLVEPDRDVERELAEISAAIKEESGGRFVEMLRRPYLRATVFVIGLGFFIQITGINAIVYYSPRLFDAMGFHGNFSMLGLPAIVQAAALAAVLISVALVDRLGRRPILLSGIAAMVAADMLLIVVFAAHSPPIFGFIGVLVFTMGFTFGFGALVWVYAGESFPSRLRSIGSSVMLTVNHSANAIVAGAFLTTLHSLGGAGTFGIFAAFTVCGFAFVYRYAPETKGRQLEEIRHFWENDGRWSDESISTATDVPACH
jgi:MFS family permease